MTETILTTVVTVLVSLIITVLFNGIIKLPKKIKQEKEDQEKDKEKFRTELINDISKSNDKLYSEFVKQAEATKEIILDVQMCKSGVQAVIKSNLRALYEKWIGEGYSPLETKDDLEHMYQVYHKLGSNGVMDQLRETFMALPTTIPKK